MKKYYSNKYFSKYLKPLMNKNYAISIVKTKIIGSATYFHKHENATSDGCYDR